MFIACAPGPCGQGRKPRLAENGKIDAGRNRRSTEEADSLPAPIPKAPGPGQRGAGRGGANAGLTTGASGQSKDKRRASYKASEAGLRSPELFDEAFARPFAVRHPSYCAVAALLATTTLLAADITAFLNAPSMVTAKL